MIFTKEQNARMMKVAQMSLNKDLGFATNPDVRSRIRELAERPNMDDYDRGVLMLLDDFARAMVLIGALSAASQSRSEQPAQSRNDAIEECAKLADAEQRRQQVIVEFTKIDEALSDTGRQDILAIATAERDAAGTLSARLRALKDGGRTDDHSC